MKSPRILNSWRFDNGQILGSGGLALETEDCKTQEPRPKTQIPRSKNRNQTFPKFESKECIGSGVHAATAKSNDDDKQIWPQWRNQMKIWLIANNPLLYRVSKKGSSVQRKVFFSMKKKPHIRHEFWKFLLGYSYSTWVLKISFGALDTNFESYRLKIDNWNFLRLSALAKKHPGFLASAKTLLTIEFVHWNFFIESIE